MCRPGRSPVREHAKSDLMTDPHRRVYPQRMRAFEFIHRFASGRTIPADVRRVPTCEFSIDTFEWRSSRRFA
jgi:hypothetical protein